MNKIFKTASLVAGTLLIALSSCKKADEATPVESLGSGTVKGQLFYDKDETNDGDGNGTEFVDTDPATGAIIRFTYEDAITGETVVGTTTVDGNGNYSFSVPTNNDGVDVEVEVDDYEASLRFEYIDEDGDDRETTESGFFSGFSIDDVTVVPGKTVIIAKEEFGGFTSTTVPSNRNNR